MTSSQRFLQSYSNLPAHACSKYQTMTWPRTYQPNYSTQAMSPTQFPINKNIGWIVFKLTFFFKWKILIILFLVAHTNLFSLLIKKQKKLFNLYYSTSNWGKITHDRNQQFSCYMANSEFFLSSYLMAYLSLISHIYRKFYFLTNFIKLLDRYFGFWSYNYYF